MSTVFPVVRWSGREPVVSSGYQTSDRPDHNGVDIMFRRQPSDALLLPVNSPGGSRGFVMPTDIDVVAWREGVLWSAGMTSTGYTVVVAHDGGQLATAYRHLASIAVPEVQRGAGGIKISAGQKLGIVGASPLDAAKLRHLHFEVWQGGGYEANVDPAPFLDGARVIDAARWKIVALLAGLLALFGFTKRHGGGVS